MNVQFTINLWVVVAIIVMGLGAFAAFYGFMSGLDPEGRGGGLGFLIPIGLLVFVAGLLFCLYRLGAVFGFWS